jgi:hypothetical protein
MIVEYDEALFLGHDKEKWTRKYGPRPHTRKEMK